VDELAHAKTSGLTRTGDSAALARLPPACPEVREVASQPRLRERRTGDPCATQICQYYRFEISSPCSERKSICSACIGSGASLNHPCSTLLLATCSPST
jgi:hypothetical protein